MRFLGQTEVVSFLLKHPAQAEILQAWLAEIRHREWSSAEAIAADFQSIDTTASPLAVFRFGRPALLIETLVDFRNGVILLTGIRMAANSGLIS